MRLVLTLALLFPATALALDLPDDGDAWTDCANTVCAQEVGWTTTCGLSQALTVSTDCAVGDAGVGVTATRAYWCSPFRLVRSENLLAALGWGFWHRSDHAGWPMSVRVVTEPDADEAALGCTAKRAVWTYPTTTAWTREDFSFDAAVWQWEVNGMWTTLPEGDPRPTQLVMVEWSFCTYLGVEIGDEMLLDGLSFQLGDTGVGSAPEVRLGTPHPNPANPRVMVPVLLEGEATVTVDVCDLVGRRVARLHHGRLPDGPNLLMWDGRRDDGGDAAAGVYLVRALVGRATQARRIVLVR